MKDDTDNEYVTAPMKEIKIKLKPINLAEARTYLERNPGYAQAMAVLSIAQTLEAIVTELKIGNDLEAEKHGIVINRDV